MSTTTIGIEAPAIRSCGPRRMAVVRTVGHPAEVAGQAAGTLYRSVYALSRLRSWDDRGFDVGALTALWPDAHLTPKHEWLGVWGLEVPPDVSAEELPELESGPQVELETWPGGDFAEVVHHGSFANGNGHTALERLRGFIADQGYEIDGAHEEQYLTRPGAEEAKTKVRYRIRPSA
jgi:GyrI-like small molecule binding domain